MPVMRGPEMYRVLKAHPAWRFIPILVLSAAMPSELAELAVEGVLRKPFELDDLRDRVEALLSGPAAWMGHPPIASR